MNVSENTVTFLWVGTGLSVQLKDANPNELQFFIDEMPASIKGKSVRDNFSKLCLGLLLE